MQDHHHLKIDITRSSTPPADNFRVNAIRSDYDYTVPEVTEHFTGEIILPDDWQIGVIRKHKPNFGKTSRCVKTASFVIRKHR